jgi:CRP/FNR family transcriptional regulator, cyclic AMP receptor protein
MVQQNAATHESRSFPSHAFFSTSGDGRQLVSFKKNATIFTQGDATTAVFFIQSGRVKLSVVSGGGREAILGILSERTFVGESGLVGRLPRMSSATALTDCTLMRIEKKAMDLAIRKDSTLASFFVYYLLERNVRHQEDLVDQLFNSSEKRLARVLLLLADSGKQAVSGSVVPKLPQETLAEMVGTTRSRVSFFLNRFRKLGLIHYETGSNLLVDCSRLQVVLRDDHATGSTAGHNSTVDVNSDIFQNRERANDMIRVSRLDKISRTRRKKEQPHSANQSEPARVLGSAA